MFQCYEYILVEILNEKSAWALLYIFYKYEN